MKIETPKEYRHLLGKEVTLIATNGDKTTIFPIAINPEKGITCYGNYWDSEPDDPPVEMVCLNKDSENYKRKFGWILQALENGVYDITEKRRIFEYFGSDILANCTFK